ncbi:MAG TPA: sugar transferase [Nitriliruptorales bacterium]|nr:sugar transferase [Nitriliruptorales bacterium]
MACGDPGWAGKRVLDLTVATIALVVFSPLMLVVAVLVKLDSPGPVLFRQERLGKDMRRFTMLKFRTMRQGASGAWHRDFIAQLADPDPAAVSLTKLTDDPRVTRVGRILRKMSLDELPQLLNVIAGEMSLVGPRPALDYEVQLFDTEHFERFAVRPGVTGLWQVSGRSELRYHEMLELDLHYVRSSTLLTDLRILARTPRAAIGHTA